MPQGTVKKVVAERGFGFISPNDNGPDVFFHCTSLPDRQDIDNIKEGAVVNYETETTGEGKVRAKSVDIV